MSKTSTDLTRRALSGPTMGTRWSALFFADGIDPAAVQHALQAAVDEIDAQMSTWRADSDLMRLNAAPVGEWVPVPAHLMAVLRLGLQVGRASGGAFDIGMGDAVGAWGFGPAPAGADRIRQALSVPRRPAHELLELDHAACRARKAAPATLDLNGIAKGYGVDRLAETLQRLGIRAALVGIDGEMRAFGSRPDGQAWAVAVETPDPHRRAAHSVLVLRDAAVATTGDYRHRVRAGERDLPHTMDPQRGAPLLDPPASVTVVARTCAEADAWASALMVLGEVEGAALARRLGLDAVFLLREAEGIRSLATGHLFGAPAGADEPRVPVHRCKSTLPGSPIPRHRRTPYSLIMQAPAAAGS
ncbi:FAD:protein FMN transferase [Paracoccus sp. S-4012]|uniref:FAD:protein FMN transferase n=1 Tax=Paracoccus sp. S-4012 TaxID=2665648 RepID=UPI0012AFBF34|nr:FAD:protein FMN transferase [Paracoccus sp. S-4012]MRX51669.1 FAD:protein FMN transferase [Paracoccus sp. S-4012]